MFPFIPRHVSEASITLLRPVLMISKRMLSGYASVVGATVLVVVSPCEVVVVAIVVVVVSKVVVVVMYGALVDVVVVVVDVAAAHVCGHAISTAGCWQ